MKRNLNRLMGLLLTIALAIGLMAGMNITALADNTGAYTTGKGQKTWEGETVEHKGFKDLGNYVIELPDYTDPAAMDKGIELINELADHAELPDLGGCTVLLKKNSAGEVVIGRNMDQDISQTPAYVFKSTT